MYDNHEDSFYDRETDKWYSYSGFTEDEIDDTEDEIDETEDEIDDTVNDTINEIDNTENRLPDPLIKEAIKLIAGLNNKEQIQNKIIKKLFHDSLDYMINRYAIKESLPLEYVKIAQQDNCLDILIKGFLKKVGGYVLTSEIVDEINNKVTVEESTSTHKV